MLPKPFLHQVLASLPGITDLCNALRVCSEWRDVGRSLALWNYMWLKLHGLPTPTEWALSGPQLLQQRRHILRAADHSAEVISSNCFQLCYDNSHSTIVAVAQGPYAVSYDAHPVWFIPAPTNPVFHRRGRSLVPTGTGEVVVIDAEGIHVWGAHSQEKRATLACGPHQPRTVAADGRFAVTASEEELCIWCLQETCCIVRHTYPDVLPAVNGALQVAVSAELDLVAFGGLIQDPYIHVLQASTGRPVTRLPATATAGLCFNSSQLLVLSVFDKTRGKVKARVTIWDTSTWASSFLAIAAEQLDALAAPHSTHLQVRAGLLLFSAAIKSRGSPHARTAILAVSLPAPATLLDSHGWRWVGVSEEDAVELSPSPEAQQLLLRWPAQRAPALVAVEVEQMAQLHIIHQVQEQAAAVGEGLSISSFAAAPDGIIFTATDGSMRCIEL